MGNAEVKQGETVKGNYCNQADKDRGVFAGTAP